MRKILLAAFVAATLCGCTGKQTKESIVLGGFYEYVQTDFDNPNDFIEVTDVNLYDSITNEMLLNTIGNLEELSDYLSEEELSKVAYFKEKLEGDKEPAYFYEIKARVDVNGRKRVKTYYALLEGERTDIYEEKPFIHELRGLYKDFYEFCIKIIKEDL